MSTVNTDAANTFAGDAGIMNTDVANTEAANTEAAKFHLSKSKVFVEFFSEEALENIMTLLWYKPERIIYLGHKHNMITKKILSTRRFAERVSPETVLEFIEVPRDDLDLCLKTVRDIRNKYPEACFELTGGGEMFLIAYGILSAEAPLHSLRIDPYTNTEVHMLPGQTPITEHADVSISVEEDIILHGGALREDTGSFSTWRFTDDFREDIKKIWSVACSFKHSFNKHCAVLEDMLKKHPAHSDGYVKLPKSGLQAAAELLFALADINVLTDLTEEGKCYSFRFKNNMIKNVVTKTGNILELHVYEVATRIPTSFTDAVISAVIDWDGNTTKSADTQNEIDVILMRNVAPIFISCKSGHCDSKALHELETVTSRFGGKYAKKVLIMSVPADTTVSGASFFKQRAKDMHIWVLDNVYEMSDDLLINKLRRIQGV